MKQTVNEKIINVANGRQKADLVLKNANIINVFTESIETGDVAIADGMIAGIGSYEGVTEKDIPANISVPDLLTDTSISKARWSHRQSLRRRFFRTARLQ